jgi:ATP/maltotriose-dependent transcriptional regulator MalT
VERVTDGTLPVPDDQRPLVLASAGEYALLIQRDADRATILLDDCLAIARDPSDAKAIALAVWCRAILMTQRGDHTSAEAAANEALARWRALDEGSWRIVDALCEAGHVAWRADDRERAEAAFTEALGLAQRTNGHWVLPRLLLALGVCARERGDGREAVALLADCLRAIQESQQHMGIHRDGFGTFQNCAIDAVLHLSAIASELGRDAESVRLLRAASTIGSLHEPATWPLVASKHDHPARPNRHVVSQSSSDSSRIAGTQLPVEDAVNEALALADAILEEPSTPPVTVPALSRREREVLAFLAQGRSNRSIAEALSLSERTVETHVLHILSKLDLDSRSAAAAYAVRHGLE